ncbi:MAG: TonB-dependent receptor [Kofleriaceae bacterium]
MARSHNSLILATLAIAGWGGVSRADEPPAQTNPPSTTHPVAPAPAKPASDASVTTATPPLEGLTDEQIVQLAGAEVVEIVAERPDKPFDRDTTVRLTGEELAQRGAVDLGTALALLPDVTVRDAGRGGFNIDIRGARKGSVAIMIDGVNVTDPYYGTFDVSTIPITDIVQIRVSTTPQSPIDGPGGPGGVIEVLTRDAIGDQLVIARMTGDSAPSFGLTGTARVALSRRWALRLSGSGLMGTRDLELPFSASIDEGRRAATGAARLQYRNGDRIIVADGFLDDRSYLAPPSDTMRGSILMIDRETSARASIAADAKLGGVQAQAQYWAHYLHRVTRTFADPALENLAAIEDLSALRSGARALVTKSFKKDFRWIFSTTVGHEKAIVSNQLGQYVRGDATLIELAAGAQYERKKLRLDSAVGLAMPFGISADPWPEAKGSARYRVHQHVELIATTGYKGRVPSLRERYDSLNGNPTLDPEKALHGELRTVVEAERLRIEAAPFYRRASGIIRASPIEDDMGRLINLGTLNIYGADLQGRIKLHSMVEVGSSYNYIRARTGTANDEPLDRLPHHRFDAWTRVFPHARLSALVRVKYFGRSIDKGASVSGYATMDGNLTAQLGKDYLAVIRVDDALDEQPETRMGFHGPGRVYSVILQGTWQ